MNHSNIVPFILLKKEGFSIVQIAELIISFYKKLSEGNSDFRSIYTVSEKKPLHQVIDVQTSNSIQLLAEEVLHQNIDDIRKIDRVNDPDINYFRDGKGGVSIGLQTKVGGETFMTLSFSFYLNRSAIGPIVINELCFDTFLKAKSFLEDANHIFSVDYSVMKIADRILNKISREYVAPLGWITYFSTTADVDLPTNLNGIEYERTDEGVYMIASRKDISVDPKEIDLQRDKLVDAMREVERYWPAYYKRYDSLAT